MGLHIQFLTSIFLNPENGEVVRGGSHQSCSHVSMAVDGGLMRTYTSVNCLHNVTELVSEDEVCLGDNDHCEKHPNR